jgi:N-acetyl-gamma-glutamyl-phosphate reductase common form
MTNLQVGVLGASGYMGGEALRILLEHPGVDVAWATSRRPEPIEHFHPNLFGSGLRTIRPDETTPCDAVLLALPTDVSMHEAPKRIGAGNRVIDLGSAFRLDDRECWEKTYGMAHTCWDLAAEAVYGIAELHAEAIAEARLVANPGCFSTAAILALAPLLAEGWIERDRIIVDGLSGTAGVGAEVTRAAHHPEIGSNLVAYNAIGHRHTLEMEQELQQVAGAPVCVHFTPVYVPVVRGILDLCHAFPTRTVTREAALALYRDYYQKSPFVQIWDLPPEPAASWQYRPYPWVSAVTGTNFCQIGIDVDPERGRILVLSALDSLGKGGAQAGVENLNLMFGLPRTMGLTRRGSHP